MTVRNSFEPNSPLKTTAIATPELRHRALPSPGDTKSRPHSTIWTSLGHFINAEHFQIEERTETQKM